MTSFRNTNKRFDDTTITSETLATLATTGRSTKGTCEAGDGCTKTATVVMEVMPMCWRGTHEAAGNSGSYPQNGARRLHVCAGCAENLQEQHGRWAREVRSC